MEKKAGCLAVISLLVVLIPPMRGLNRQDIAMAPGVDLPALSAAEAESRQGYFIFRETLVDLTWPEVKKAAEAGALVLLPVGVIEEHGPHMGLGTDAYLAYMKCLLYKHELEARGVSAVIAPPVYWGVMQQTQTGAYPGSFTVRPETMKALLIDIYANLHNWGFRRVFAINHHGDRIHRRVFAEALAEAKQSYGLEFYNDRFEEDQARVPDLTAYIAKDLFEPDYHAGASETSEMAEYFPEQVDLSVAKTLKPQKGFQPLGYVGDPANYARVNIRALDKVETSYYADCIAKWMKTAEKPKAVGGEKK
jgi:creatinine amidohydrolase